MDDQMPLSPTQFGESHFHRMNIEIISPQPVAVPNKKRKINSATSRGQDEAQSFAPQQAYSDPSISQAALQTVMQTEFKKMREDFTTAITALSHSFDSFRDIVSGQLTSLTDSVQGLDGRVGSLEQFVRENKPSPSAPPTGSEPSSSDN